MKKLLFVISQFYKGGAETSLLNLVKCLDKTKYQIDFIILNQRPVSGAVSLVEQLPKEVHLLDAFKAEQKLTFADKVRAKTMLTEEERRFPLSAVLFLRNRLYDWAFHVGEWWSPQFVARCVRAKRKCAWIHTDLAEAEYFGEKEYFQYSDFFSHFIFVSQNSLQSSLKKYPFLQEKALCIYNINLAPEIRKDANQPVDEDYFESGLPVVLTCANIRPEKNHRRALEAMGILKKRGVDFLWVNIGSTAEKSRCADLLSRAAELGLEDRFILAGPKSNPYSYISRADIVAVLSDYESWSMVITEAKILEKTIISTRTSGALEQIEDRVNGLLTDFDENDIADKLEELLTSEKLRERFRENLKDFDNTEEILESFDAFVNQEPVTPKKDLLYVIDDINYLGGAHVATKLQIRELLKTGAHISVFSNTTPSVMIRNELAGVHFVSWADFPEDTLFHRRLLDCMVDSKLSPEQKVRKLRMTFRGKIKKDHDCFGELVMPRIKQLFSGYETVCVMSEGSPLRKYVADADSGRKIQWIHTDYCDWINMSDWAKKASKNDAELYKKFDLIVVLTPGIRDKFIALYPHLADKVVVNRNLMPVDSIKHKCESTVLDYKPLHFTTVCRIDRYKGFGSLYHVLLALYKKGYRFQWDIVGGGPDFDEIRKLYNASQIRELVRFTGPLKNPYPYVKRADVFALLSSYEGLPNTIFEALILGVPVLATNVGGVGTQIEDGVTGWLVENNEKAIFEKLEFLMSHPEEADRMKENLKDYQYDNAVILQNAEQILLPHQYTATKKDAYSERSQVSEL